LEDFRRLSARKKSKILTSYYPLHVVFLVGSVQFVRTLQQTDCTRSSLSR